MTATDRPVEDSQSKSVQPDALMAHAKRRNFLGTVEATRGAKLARKVGLELLRRMYRDQVILIDHTGSGGVEEMRFGVGSAASDPAALRATIEVVDPKAWIALVTEGSIGLGRGYFEGWWDSDDPTTVVRIGIRNFTYFNDIRNKIQARTGWALDRLRRLLPARDRFRNREDIAAHYDLGNDFFKIFLDETLTYSSAVFSSADTGLVDGSLAKYDRLLAKLGVNSSHNLLEIGTGWGGFALRAVDSTGCKVTTTTISAEQLDEARKRVRKARRSDDVTLLASDWRDLNGRFDRVVSIEMIEAVDWRDYDQYFSTIERCLKPDGLVAIQAICVPDRSYERTKNTEDFIRRFIFPGGFLPSVGAITRSVSKATKMQIVDVEDLSAHYAETLRRWRLTFDERLDEVYALGLDERFARLWRFYLAYCEAGFLERHCTVNQFVIAGADWRDELRLRP